MQSSYPIWHFDATGSIIKNISGQKKPFFYSIVSRDIKNKLILPVAEFVTTSHDSISITKYLFSIKKIFENSLNENKRFIIPPIVVTDFSWALIISVLEAFNNCSVVNYINWAFDVLFKYSENNQLNQLMKTRIIICQTHIFKAVVQKTNICIDKKRLSEKNYDKQNKIKKLFLFSFTILQNSTSINEFNEVLKDLYKIFCLKNYSEEINSCVTKIQQLVMKRNFDLFKIIDVESLSKIKNDESEMNIYINLNSKCNSIKQSSPFNKYFDSMIKILSKERSEVNKHKEILNRYYFPELFNIIQEKLYVIPLWTGIMIKQCSKVKPYLKFVSKDSKIFELTRITNNPVENRMDYLKNKLLMKKKNLFTSEIVKPIYTDIKSKYFEYYSESDCNFFNFEGLKSSKNTNEQWIDKNSKLIKREKSFYYKNLLNTQTSHLNLSTNFYSI